jgi:hypothetical protein
MAVATQSRANRFDARCADCFQPVPAGMGDLTRQDARWITRHVGTCPPAPAATPTVDIMPDTGYYAVEWNGDLKFYVVREGKGGWTGRKFLNRYRSDELDRPGVRERTDVIALIMADVAAARETFARETTRCYRCGRRLTDAESRARGIGPDCARM